MADVASAAVVVIPGLAHHLYGDEQRHRRHAYGQGEGLPLQFPGEQIRDGHHAESAPDGEGVERACVRVVALTGLHWRLVEIENDGQSCHEEKEEDHPELLYASLAVVGLPEEAYQAQQQGQTIENVVPFVVFQVIG